MAEQSLLARLGMRIGVLGSAASLAVCFPLASGNPSIAAHTDATRIGMYATHATNNGIMGLVVGGVETLDIQGDGATTWIGIPTVSQPALSPANKGSIYYDDTIQGFMASYNGAAYVPFGGSSISGLTAGRVVIAASPTTVTDFPNLTYSTAHGFSNNRAGAASTEAFGLDAGNSTMTSTFCTLVGKLAGNALTNGANNTLVGYSAGTHLTGGSQNTALGISALAALVTANDCTAIGYLSLTADTGGRRNTAVGSQTLLTLVTATDNTAVGYNALNAMDTSGFGGSEMTAVGSGASQSNNFFSFRNVAVGFMAMQASGAAIDGVAVGHLAATATGNAQRFTAIGSSALPLIGGGIGGNDNTALGYGTGSTITTGNANIFLGSGAGDSTAAAASNRLIVGSSAAPISTGYIGNGETNTAPQAFTLNGTGGSGANVAGASVTIAGGQGTGTGTGGSVVVRTAPVSGSSSTLNALVTRITVGGDGGSQWTGIATTSAPAVSSANNGTLYYDNTSQTFKVSLNGAAYVNLSTGGGISGLTAGRVTFAASATSITDSAQMVFSTAAGFSVNRAIGVPDTTSEMFGKDAGNTTFTGAQLVAVGNGAGNALTSAPGTTLVGYHAGNLLQSGASNTAIGNQALAAATTAADSAVVGYHAGAALVGGLQNTALGSNALATSVAASDNVAVGYNALNQIDAFGAGGSEMTMVGSRAGQGLDFTSLRNTGVGFRVLSGSQGLVDMTAVGHQALRVAATTAVSDVAVGSAAFGALTTGKRSVALGYSAGSTTTTGSDNIFLGSTAGDSTGATSSNRFVVGSSASPITTVWIGNGESNAAPSGFTLNATGGSGANVAGAPITVAGGQGTGTGTGGSIIIQTAPVSGSSSTPNALVARITVGGDGGTQWTGIATASAPAVSSANNGTLYYNATTQTFKVSLNGVAYVDLATGGGSISGLTAGRVPFAASATSLADSAQMVFSTANGFSVNRAIAATTTNEMFGKSAGNTAMTGASNTLVGNTAGNALTNAADNTLLGTSSGVNLTTGAQNTFVGSSAGFSQLAQASQVAVGYGALAGNATPANNTGTQNVAVGYRALFVNSSGSNGTALGYSAGGAVTTGSDNTLIGTSAGSAVTTGGTNTFIGSSAGSGWTTISSQTAVGYQALLGGGALSGTQNTALGYQSGKAVSSGANNTLLGHQSGTAINTGADNTHIGTLAGSSTTSGGTHVFIGSSAGQNWTTVSSLTAVGYQALQGSGALSGTNNTAVGYQSGLVVSTGSDNAGFGYITLKANTTGSGNTALGSQAAAKLTTSANCTAVGNYALNSATNGMDSNVAVGMSALLNLNSNGASSNTALGSGALTNATNGTNNVAIGANACPNASNISETVAIGRSVLGNISTGSDNTVVGYNAAGPLTTGAGNIVLGSGAGSNMTNNSAARFVAGSDTFPVNDVWFGKGDLSATATTYTIHGTDGLGADKVGATLNIAAGRGTGAGTPGTITFQTAVAAGSSSTLQTLTTAMTILANATHDVRLDTGNLVINTAGSGLQIKEGSNARMGTATLTLGTVTVANTSITANTRIYLTVQSLGTVAVATPIAVTARVNGTSFTITSSSATDTSVIAWLLVEPA